jgi:salicylate hydroxylase
MVYLKSEATKYDPEAGSVQFSNGQIVSADLVIAADGVHTGADRAVAAIIGEPNRAWLTRNYNFAYRFLIPTADITADPDTVQFTEDDEGYMKFVLGENKRLVWYPCRE